MGSEELKHILKIEKALLGFFNQLAGGEYGTLRDAAIRASAVLEKG